MKSQENDIRARLIAMISREEMDFIDGIGKDALFSTGHKLTRTDVIEAILDAVAALAINGKDIHTKEELTGQILKAIEEKISKMEK